MQPRNVSVPSSSGRFSSGPVVRTDRAQSAKFQSPLRRGGSRRLSVARFVVNGLLEFQSPLRRGGSRRITCDLGTSPLTSSFSPLFVGEVLVGSFRDFSVLLPYTTFQSPLRRGGSRRSSSRPERERAAGFSPLFVGEVLVGSARCSVVHGATSFQSPLRRGGSRRVRCRHSSARG